MYDHTIRNLYKRVGLPVDNLRGDFVVEVGQGTCCLIRYGHPPGAVERAGVGDSLCKSHGEQVSETQ